MVLAIIALATASLSPAFAYAPAPEQQPSVTAPAFMAADGKACAIPNADVTVTYPAPPELPKGLKLDGVVTGSSRVTVGPTGKVVSARIQRSSGNAAVDQTILKAAKSSTYSPKIVDCKAVQGTYLFFAQFDRQL